MVSSLVSKTRIVIGVEAENFFLTSSQVARPLRNKIQKEATVQIIKMQTIEEIYGSAERDLALECIEACTLCEFACLAYADASLRDGELDSLAQCICLSLDCAEICLATRGLIAEAFRTAPRLLDVQLSACGRSCAACAAECQRQEWLDEQVSACVQACMHCERLCHETRLQLRNLQ